MNLLQAINQNNVDRVKELLSNSRTKVNVTDNHNFTGKMLNYLICESLEIKNLKKS